MSDPANVLAQDEIATMTLYGVRPAVASAAGIDKLLERLADPDFGNGASAPLEDDDEVVEPHRQEPSAPAGPMYDFKEQAPINFGASGEDSSVIQLVHRVIKEAVERGSSDIHIEPGDEDCASATASTACSTRRPPRSPRAPSRRGLAPEGHGRTSTSPSAACRRTAASRSSVAGPADRPAVSARCRAPTARTSSCESSTRIQVMIDLDQLGMLPQALERFTRACSRRPTAPSSSPARPAPARRPRSTPR